MMDGCFREMAHRLELVALPIVLQGGERLKNSYFHVSEIHSQIDRHDLDRHSYLVAWAAGPFWM